MNNKYDDDLDYDKLANLPIIEHDYTTKPLSRPVNSANSRKNAKIPRAGANPLLSQTTPGLEFNRWGNIVVDENCKTSMEGVYAGGDIVLGDATVILAMGQGRIAAAAINKYLEARKEAKST